MTRDQEIQLQGVRYALLIMEVMYADKEIREELYKLIESRKETENAKSLPNRS